jgi:hypothetical protein
MRKQRNGELFASYSAPLPQCANLLPDPSDGRERSLMRRESKLVPLTLSLQACRAASPAEAAPRLKLYKVASNTTINAPAFQPIS